MQQFPTPPGQSPIPATKGKLSPVAIILIVVGVGWGLILVVSFAVGVAIGYRRTKTAGLTTTNPVTVPLNQSYTTSNGLLTAHYPADFAAKALDSATVALTRNFTAGENEVLTLAAVPNPITNDAREFARLLHAETEKIAVGRGGTYTHTGERAATCLGSYPGWEVEVTYSFAILGSYVSKSCFFLIDNTGYELRYDVPRSRAVQEAVLMDRIIAATEIKRTPEPDPESIELTESYDTPNKLLTAHYPSDFAAKALDDATIVLSKNLAGAEGDVLTLAAVADPITNDVNEFARLLDSSTEKKALQMGGTYTRTGKRPGTCLGSYPGVQTEQSMTLPGVGPIVSKACFFIRKNKGYELRYDIPAARATRDAVLMDRIIAATTLH